MKCFSAVRLGAAFVLLQSTACVSVIHTQTADTLGQGNVQVGVAPSYVRAVGDDSDSSGFFGGAQAQMLYGVKDDVDVGGRVSYQRVFLGEGLGSDTSFAGYGLQALSKFKLRHTEKLKLSLAPSLGYTRVTSSSDGSSSSLSAIEAKVPLLVGIPVGEHQFVLGPTVSDVFFMGGGDTSNTINIGATAGFAFKVPNSSVRVMPELGMLYPLVGSVPGSGTSFNDDGSFYLQFGVGLMFDVGSGSSASGDSADSDSSESASSEESEY